MTARFGWRALLLACAASDFVLLVLTAVLLRDWEASIVAALALAGLALLRYKKRLLGTVVLTLLFVNVAFWMIPGTVSNVAHAEGALDLLLPAALAGTSVTGAVAAVAFVVTGFDPGTGRRAAIWVALAGATLFLVVPGAVLISGSGEPARSRPSDLVLKAKNSAFSSETLRASAGRIGVYLSNQDLFWHTFTIDSLEVDLRVPVRGERRLTFVAPPGTYEFYCRIPGHELVGMRGTLVVR